MSDAPDGLGRPSYPTFLKLTPRDPVPIYDTSHALVPLVRIVHDQTATQAVRGSRIATVVQLVGEKSNDWKSCSG